MPCHRGIAKTGWPCGYGAAHTFRWETVIGGQKMRPEPGEPVVAVAGKDEPFRLLAPIRRCRSRPSTGRRTSHSG